MSIEEMFLQYCSWFKEVVVDLLKAWMIIYAVGTIIAYHLGV